MGGIVPQRRRTPPDRTESVRGSCDDAPGPGRDAMFVWWIGAVAIAVVAAAVFVFNDLVAARNQVRAAWSDIDVQLTRRHDLVPQLVAAVQGYASYERATL